MGRREDTLKALLRDAGYSVVAGVLPRPRDSSRAVIPPNIRDELERVYRRLGGVLSECPINPGGWDLEIAGVAVELDEEQHFNRYRAVTLESRVYEQARGLAEDYGAHCARYEHECLRKASNRGYWSSERTVRQFGSAAEQGVFDGAGSPRWKQRAFYDLVKDLAPRLVGTHVARIAIWDELDLHGQRILMKDVLKGRAAGASGAVVALIERRSGVRLKA